MNIKKSKQTGLVGNLNANLFYIKKENKLKNYIVQVSKSDQYKEKIEEEYKELINYIVNIEKISKENFGDICTIGYAEQIENLIKLIDISSTTLSPYLIKLCLRTFRKIIELENPSNTNPSAEWETKEYIDRQKNIIKK